MQSHRFQETEIDVAEGMRVKHQLGQVEIPSCWTFQFVLGPAICFNGGRSGSCLIKTPTSLPNY